jgi:hypothetical protein
MPVRRKLSILLFLPLYRSPSGPARKENLTVAFLLSYFLPAGLTSPSPLEVRELGPDKASLLVCVFGRNLAAKTQERRSFMCVSSEDHAALSAALATALDFKQS